MSLPDGSDRRLPHLTVQHTASTEVYAPRGGGPRLRTPARDRLEHAAGLLDRFGIIRREYRDLATEREASGFDPRTGLVLQFASSPDFDLKFESLDLRAQGIQLLSVRHQDNRTIAVCYVPDGKLEHFITRIEQYRA